MLIKLLTKYYYSDVPQAEIISMDANETVYVPNLVTVKLFHI